eukprot:CAMPEP_0113668728 /NCGR_PEP_ID=MMETSP0038_2-20120614/4162_1 /TAXON_ID=2898 /ORGANISM="Cryptomonas paramecium" /LENGTH=72 /DNA_ID=CAMNT_0000584505 /DNA_START=99 /DNA_END=313 /DNA_ORIENTATION=- /assembly_acc=CAM_ASM_000170
MAKLSEGQAIEIFAIKLNNARQESRARSSISVARQYNVTDKTVRDIWRGRTWIRETSTLLDPVEAARRLSLL